MAKPLVLVVDDEKQVADMIAQAVNESDRYEALTAYSGQQALEVLKKHKQLFGLAGNRIRFVFLDIKMPEIDGLALLEKIRQNYAEDLGVSMLTAWEDEEKWDKATSGFVVNYLKKPFKSEEVLTTLDRFFAGDDAEMTLETFKKHIDKKKEFKQEEKQ